jgi:threonine dehydrogenase-like Zn-dependent dehydrogenase
VPSLPAASDVLGTGWFGASAAEAGLGKTVVVVGDGAVGLPAVLAAGQLGADRVIAVSRHADRQAPAREFGATDIVEERGDAGIARIKQLTGGPAPVRAFLPDLVERIWDLRIDPGRVFDLDLPLDEAAEAYRAMDERRATKALLRP